MKLKAIRYNCRTNKPTETAQTALLVYHGSPLNEWYIKLSLGVTGHESASVKALLKWENKDWAACAGTEGVWDRLVIPKEEVERLREALAWIKPVLDLLPSTK